MGAKTICLVTNWTPVTGTPEQHNARLIAAAPEMLEALKDAKALALAWAAHYEIAYESPGFHPKHRAILKHIDEAIAKAEESTA